MVQVLPETSNSNIWQQVARDVTTGISQGYEQGKKNALIHAINDPNASPIQRATAEEQYLAKFGKPDDLIKFRREQGRVQAFNDVNNLINPQNVNPAATQGGGNPPAEKAPLPVENQIPGNSNPTAGAPPVTAENLMQPNESQGAQTDPKALEKALFNLAQYDPPAAKAFSDILGRQQKQQIAQENQNLKERKIAVDQEHFRQNKILPMQEKAIDTIKNTNVVLKATNDQLAAIQADQTGIWSKANMSRILSDAGHENLARAVESEGGAAFKTAGKEIFTGGFKRAFGSKPLGIEFHAFDQMLAQIGRKKEVNELTVKSIQAEYEIANEVAKYQMQLLQENPDISPIELNNQTFKYEEEVTDRVFDEWTQYRDRALESVKEKSSWFQPKKRNYETAKEESTQSQPQSWQDLWK